MVLADNGVVSLNLPLNSQILSALASRSTHPRFLAHFNHLLALVFKSSVRVENTFALRTRAEALEILKAYECADLLEETVSCSRTRGRPNVQRQCGYCSQCIDRRFGVLAAGLEEHDLAERYELDVFVHPLPEGEERTVAVSYVRLANRLSRMSADDMFAEIGELDVAIDFESRDVETEARALAAMLQRHGVAVGNVLGRIVGRVQADLGHGRLPPTCLLRLALGSPPEPRRPAGVDEPSRVTENLFRREGKNWRICFAGTEKFVPHAVGMEYVLRLLQSQGRGIDVSDLRAATGEGRSRRVSREDASMLGRGGVSDPVIDRDAETGYRARLHELQAERAAAESADDVMELARIQREVEAIETELARAKGLGGRRRRFRDDRERARQAVGRAIERAIESIAEAHESLGRHLEKSIDTGWECIYSPEQPTPWRTT